MNGRRLPDLSLLNSATPGDIFSGHLEKSQGDAAGYILRDTPRPLISAALDGKEVHFVTGGKWSMHDLLAEALVITGPATLYLSTFSITEFSARQLSGHLDAGRLRELHMLVDYRAKLRYPEVYQLAANVATSIRLTPVHAKVMVLQGDDITLSVQGSANWTENPRIEAGTLTTDPGIAAFYKNFLEKSLIDGHPFN